MLDYGAIGARIKACRKRAGLSQEALGKTLGISTTHMSHIETGSTKLSLSVLAQLSKALNVSCDELLFGSRNTPDKPARTDLSEILAECSAQQLECICRLIKSFADMDKI